MKTVMTAGFWAGSALVIVVGALGATGALGSAGCDDGYQSPVDRPECVEGQQPSGCAEIEVCLGGRCYLPCASTSECSRWESCMGGICRASSVPQGDADIPTPDGDSDTDSDSDSDSDVDSDADSDADADGPCTCPRAQCHGVTGDCVECIESGYCTTLPVCDVARGICVDFSATQCAPCRTDMSEQCGAGIDCVDRRTGDHWETVCLTTCTVGCPQGTECLDGVHCTPLSNGSCTAWYANLRGRTCMSASDCLPLGEASSSVGCTGSPASCSITCTGVLDGECPPGRTCSGGYCL
jgi:hypothetical protein